MKKKIIELMLESKEKYWDAFPAEGVDSVDECSKEAILIDKLDSEFADKIIKLFKKKS